MLTQLEKAKALWGGASDTIDRWFAERQQLLVCFCELAAKAPNGQTPLPDTAQLESFCELLMDYLSAGHFEIFEQIVSQCEKRGPDSLALANRIYPKITETTQAILDFNDRYAEIESEEQLFDLGRELGRLGEVLERRFELEDRLIQTLYSHQAQPA
ncbi:sigma D regulator [Gallaecimonas sp. GXIMD4217]|uniref:sigma D regulator n=1 Tax=Gallaecimonas sp. GXIMD4217 TaxID=3131927 RepID=UPI00311B41DD